MARSDSTKINHRGKSKPSRQSVGPRFSPITNALQEPFVFADTELSQGMSQHHLGALLAAVISRKRRYDGEPLENLLCALLTWPLLAAKSIHCFCSELCQFLTGKVSVMYDFLEREDINWRGLSSEVARQVFKQNDLGPRCHRAFVVDDSTKARAGRKVEGTSCHFDHTQGKTIKGHQVLQLGISGEKGFLPIEAQIVMSEVAAVEKPEHKPFRDQRSSAARNMRRAREKTKMELFRDMINSALQAGFAATYLLADAWFGCKDNIALAVETGLIGIFQMKRGKLQYRHNNRNYTAAELYAKIHRQMRPKSPKARYKTASMAVEMNLETKPCQSDRWVEVRLVFSAPVRSSSANTWVVFLCTSLTLSDEKILEVYSLRWSIEVYFKEVKQNLGFLKEQSGRYQVAYASVHLSAIRYLLLFEAMLRSGRLTFGEVRDQLSGQLKVLTYATLLWELFRALIEGALDDLAKNLGRDVVNKVLAAIDQTVEAFLNDALQMKPETVAVQCEAEKLGYL